MSRIHCFYHGCDLDGHCSGAIVKYKYPEAVMWPINYGDEFPWNDLEAGGTVIMVDRDGGHLYWIDHHKSAIFLSTARRRHGGTKQKSHEAMAKLGSDPHGSRNTSKASCELTWEWLFPDKPVPLAVKLLSLYDSWTYQGHELEEMVLPFQMRMRMENLDPKDWGKCFHLWNELFASNENPPFNDPTLWVYEKIKEGGLILRYDEEQKRRYVQTYRFETRLLTTKTVIEEQYKRLSMQTPDRSYKAIAVNLGHTNSKVFDSVWRKKCRMCDGSGERFYSMPIEKMDVCDECNGTGYIEPYDLMITFCRRIDHKWNISLYSTKANIDCGAIAKAFGGGGHAQASGFICETLPFDF